MGITAAQKMRLGIFVVIGMIVLAAFIVIPIGTKMSKRTVTYVSFFENESLLGLEQGANVKFYGVNIGKVQRVTYYPQDINRMKVEMNISDQFPMRVDMYATTALVGITGLKCVEIMGGSNEAAPLRPGGEIPTRKTFFAAIGDKVEVFIEKLETLLDHLGTVTNPDSLQSIKVAIDNIAALTGEAQGMFKDTRDVIKDTREVIPAALRLVDTVQAAVNEAVRITLDIREMTGVLKGGVAKSDIPGLLARADSTVSSVKALTDNMTLTIMQTREDFSVTMENLKEATESAGQLMRSLAENPSLLIRGEGREKDNRK